MKKILAGILGLSMIFVLTSCSKDTDKDTEIKKLTVWVHVTEDDPEGRNYDLRAKEFEEMNSGVKVTVEHIVKTGEGSGYNDRINAAITAGDLPDVIALESVYTASYVDSGILLPLNDYLSKETTDSYLDTIIEAGSVSNKLYSLQSFDLSAPVFYNVDLFNEAGITIPKDENGNWTIDFAWTFDEFLTNSKKLRNYMNEEPIHFIPDNSGWQMYAHSPLIFSNGGQIVSEDGLVAEGYLNSDSTIGAFKFIKNLFEEKLISPTLRENAFALGKAAISFEGPWMVDILNKEYPDINWSIMPYPYGKEGNNSAPHGSWYLAATQNSKHPELAAELVAHLTNKDSATVMEKEAGLIPGHKELLSESLKYKEYPMKVMLDQLVATKHLKPKSPIFPVLEDALGDIIEGIALDSKTVEELIQEAIIKIEREASRFK